MSPKSKPVIQRVLAKIQIDTKSGCWLFQGNLEHGYGRSSIGSKSKGTFKKVYVHKITYEYFVGPVPEGYEIDHLCRTRKCCNPDHLEAVTPYENKMRGESPPAINAKKTHCPRGHEYSDSNTIVTNTGFRQCKACKRLRYSRTYVRKTGRPYSPRDSVGAP